MRKWLKAIIFEEFFTMFCSGWTQSILAISLLGGIIIYVSIFLLRKFSNYTPVNPNIEYLAGWYVVGTLTTILLFPFIVLITIKFELYPISSKSACWIKGDEKLKEISFFILIFAPIILSVEFGFKRWVRARDRILFEGIEPFGDDAKITKINNNPQTGSHNPHIELHERLNSYKEIFADNKPKKMRIALILSMATELSFYYNVLERRDT